MTPTDLCEGDIPCEACEPQTSQFVATPVVLGYSCDSCYGGEALFPGLDLDSGLDWTLDWTLEKMYFWCHCSAKEASGPLPCPLEAQTLNHVHVSW